jgi:hypothetical protein
MAGVAALAAACGSTPGGRTSSAAAPAGAPAAPAAPATPQAPAAPAARPVADWPVDGRTEYRSEVSLSTPAPTGLAKSWTRPLDGNVYGQPLVVGNSVVVGTEEDTVYSLNKTTGAVQWSRDLASPVTGGLPCGDINPSGITGTPVADVSADEVWVVTFTSSPTFEHKLWSLDLSNGTTLSSRVIDAPGSDAEAEQQRGALSLLDGRVYVPYGGLAGDCSDYKGRVVSAPLTGSGPLATFVTPNEREAGIWSPPGPMVRDNSLYVATGNGTPVDAVDDSDSVIRLSPGLKQIGRFTPPNFEQLSSQDLDLGSTSPAPLPSDMVFMIGKQGVGYVLDGSRLGGTGGELASSQVCSGAAGGDAAEANTVVISCYDGLFAVRVEAGASGKAPTLDPLWHTGMISPGPPIIGGGVVWDVTKDRTLVGYELAGGREVSSTPTASAVTPFPSLSASGTRLFVPEGNEVVSYTGA